MLFSVPPGTTSDNHLICLMSIGQCLIAAILNAKMQRHKGTKNLNFASFRLCDLAVKI